MLPNLPPLSNSDHDIIRFKKFINVPEPIPKTRMDLDRGNYDAARQVAQEKLTTIVSDDPNEIWIQYRDTMLSLQDSFIPEVSTRQFNKIDNQTATLEKRKNHKHKVWKWRNSNLGTNHASTIKAKEKFKNATDKLTDHVTNREKTREQKIAKEKNPKKFFAYINKRLKTRTGVGPLTGDGHTHYNENSITEIMSKHFKTVYTAEDTSSIPNLPKQNLITRPLNTITINEVKVKQALETMNPNKSTGPDGITSRIMKETAECSSKIITKLIQRSIDTGEIPEDWKTAIISPILKKKPKENKINYRPISLTSNPSKLGEKQIKDDIVDHMNKNNLFSDSQHGGRQYRSIVTQLLEAFEDWTQNMDDNVQTDIIYFDFEKAYDRIPH